MSDELRDLRDATKARPDAIARVKHAVGGELSPADVKALLRTVPSAPAGAAARVKARVAGLARTPRRPWARVTPTRIAAVLFALAVPLALWVRAALPIAVEVGAAPVAIGGLTVEPGGHGTIGGTRAAPRLEWREGRVRLDAAARGLGGDVLLLTREAEVRARRQALAVARDPLGTTVEVESLTGNPSRRPLDASGAGCVPASITGQGPAHSAGTQPASGCASAGSVRDSRSGSERGGVEVRCLVDGATHAVAEGARIICPPVSAEGMLGRARHERAAGVGSDLVLATVDLGLSRATGSDTARDELAVLRMQLLAEAGRSREALADARAWLADAPTLRRLDVERLAAALALAEEGCAGALPHLDALAPTSLDAALRLAACAPDRAPAVLDAADALALSPADHAALAETRTRLGAD